MFYIPIYISIFYILSNGLNVASKKLEKFSPCFYYNVNIIEILFCGRKKFFNQAVMKPFLLLLMLTSRLELPNTHLNIFEQDWMSVRVKEESNLFHITTIAKESNGTNQLSSSGKVNECNIIINWNFISRTRYRLNCCK